MAKLSAVHLYNGKLLSNKKGQDINGHGNLDASQRHSTGLKPGSKGYMLYDCVYLTFSERENIAMKSRAGVTKEL